MVLSFFFVTSVFAEMKKTNDTDIVLQPLFGIRLRAPTPPFITIVSYTCMG